uniref:Uncharacterized protein n=1 Tax=Hyaloperonospora arabidopsidis (strain Emoy2) TaxID=559515 RepID=M4C1A2_HYAAE
MFNDRVSGGRENMIKLNSARVGYRCLDVRRSSTTSILLGEVSTTVSKLSTDF